MTRSVAAPHGLVQHAHSIPTWTAEIGHPRRCQTGILISSCGRTSGHKSQKQQQCTQDEAASVFDLRTTLCQSTYHRDTEPSDENYRGLGGKRSAGLPRSPLPIRKTIAPAMHPLRLTPTRISSNSDFPLFLLSPLSFIFRYYSSMA